MAGFRKAKAEQAALKIGIYGPQGSGKTFTTLLLAEGLAQHSGTRVAYVDTERGTDFYVKKIPDRQFHPEAFDIDALYTRSLTEVLRECRALDPKVHGVVVIDSITHLWEAAMNAYTGKRNGSGQIPPHAWAGIKKPYKDLMAWMINSKQHVLILGRQKNEWGANDQTGEMVATGVKMAAEGETAYEPHILLRMEGVKQKRDDGKSVQKNAVSIPTVFVEKDRSGILHGHLIEWPTFETIKPILGILGDTQATIQTDDEAASVDSERLLQGQREKVQKSVKLRKQYLAEMELAKGQDQLDKIGNELSTELKKDFLADDLDVVREKYRALRPRLPAVAPPEAEK